MPVNLILAPAAGGKTQTCLQRIHSLRQTEPLAPIWVLVPDAQNIAYFRQRLGCIGGGAGINVGTFRTLYVDLLERQGKFTPLVTSALEHQLVRQVVDAAFKAGELAYYATIKNKPGFISVLQDIFSELRSAFVSPEQFLDYTHNTSSDKQELAHLYAHFVAQLSEIGWIDQDGQIWEAIAALESDPQAATHVRLLIIDGFSAFAGARLEFLKQLSKQVGEMLVTLPGLQGSSRTVHRRTQPVIDDLLHALSPQLIEQSTPIYLPPESKHLEQYVLDSGEHPVFSTQKTIFLEAQSQDQEAREALRWIKRLHKRHGVPLSECALFASRLENYRPYLRTAADEFGIKVCFSQPDPLIKSPVVQSLLNLLEMPLEDFKTRAVINTLRSPYLDFGLSGKEIDLLELVSQKARIVKSRQQWEEAWQMLTKSNSDTEEILDDERKEQNPVGDDDFPALRQQFESFWQVFDGIETQRTQTEWVTWLESTLENLGLYYQLSGERDQEAWQALTQTLGAVVLSEQVLGANPIHYEGFLSDLVGAVQGARVDEPREANENAVFISDIRHATASRFRAVALLGFSEGLFPVVELPDPFLDEQTRADLGLDPRLGREQASTFYQAFTRADRHLLFTRPYLAEHGESWDASPYWLGSTSLFSENVLVKVSLNKSRSQAEAASPQELLFWAVQQNALHYKHDAALQTSWQNLYQSRAVLKARRMKTPQSQYEGDLSTLTPNLSELFSPSYVWSASRFETYATCPHQFYIQNLLKLVPKEPPELGLDAAQIGSILHEILEKVYRGAESAADLESLFKILEENAASVFAKAPHKYGFRPSPLWEVEKTQFVDMLRKTIEALCAQSKGWVPFCFEEDFGIAGTPDLVLDLDTEKVRLRGLIDRVDRDVQGNLRVIDYKTGGSFLSNKDLISGRRLQMPIYALAAETALKLGTVIEGFYWMIRNAEASSLKLSTFKKEGQQGRYVAYAIAVDLIKQFLSGIRAGQFSPVAPQGGCPSYCPAIQWCWRFQTISY